MKLKLTGHLKLRRATKRVDKEPEEKGTLQNP